MSCAREGAIDIHTHIVPSEFPSYIGRHPDVAWPSMQHTKPCHANVIITGKAFRSIDDRSWNVARRIEAMDEAGIERQVLSPMPELLSYWFPPEDAVVFGDYVNSFIAEMVAKEPNRMVGLGIVPLQDVDLAIKTLETLIQKQGFAGVEIGTHVNGMPIGHPSLAAFFAAAEDLSASIFVHALRPTGHERLIGPTALGAALLFPCDVALAASSMLTGGIIARHPKLRLAFSHGGGAFGLLLPRLAHMWRTVPSIRELMNEDPFDAARRLYYDTLVYDNDTLSFLIQRFGANRLLIGSDYPYQIHEPDPVGRINDLTLAPTDRQALIRENAITFLGLKVAV